MTQTADITGLPEGVETDPARGGYVRVVHERDGMGRDPDQGEYIKVMTRRRPCRVAFPGMEFDAIEDQKRDASGLMIDFYDPRPCPGCDDGRPTGWLRNGRRPEHSHTINAGRFAVEPEMERVYLKPAPASKGGTTP